MHRYTNKIIGSDEGPVISVDVATDKFPDAVMLIDKADWERILLSQEWGRWLAWECGRTLYVKANRIGQSGGKQIHRLIITDAECVDHINRNGLDNRSENLRACTKGQNGINASPKSNNKSGHTGVWLDKITKKWCAEIKVDYKKVWLGRHSNKEDAIAAREDACKKYFGEFA